MKRSNKNSYEAKTNVIEDSKGEASTSKGLKQKKAALEYRARTKKARTSASRKFCYNRNKKGHKVNECHSHPKKKKKDQQHANMTDQASPSLSAMV